MNLALAAPLSPSRATGLGLLLIAPAGIFLAANVLNEMGIGFLYALLDPWMAGPARHPIVNIVSPLVFVGGLSAALVLNLLAILRLGLTWEPGRLVSTIVIQPRLSNVAVMLTAGLLLATLAGYAFVENFAIVRTHAG